jgi:hypothetical protein
MPRLADGTQLPDGIRLREMQSGNEVVAEIIPLDRQTAKDGIDLGWWAAVQDLPKDRLKCENDKGWQWHKDVGTLRTQVGNLGYVWAARAAERIQGAILYQLGGVSELEPERATLLVYRLATAPWNRDWLRQPPQFAGVGSGLLRLAVSHSYRFGLGGRVTVEAYPDERLVNWYTNFGFRLATRDEDGISVLELTPEAAAPHLEGL